MTQETMVSLGAAKVLVRYDYEAEDKGHGAYPDTPEAVWITEIRIGDVWVDTVPFDPDWVMDAERLILERSGKQLADDMAEEAWERQQERAME